MRITTTVNEYEYDEEGRIKTHVVTVTDESVDPLDPLQEAMQRHPSGGFSGYAPVGPKQSVPPGGVIHLDKFRR